MEAREYWKILGYHNFDAFLPTMVKLNELCIDNNYNQPKVLVKGKSLDYILDSKHKLLLASMINPIRIDIIKAKNKELANLILDKN